MTVYTDYNEWKTACAQFDRRVAKNDGWVRVDDFINVPTLDASEALESPTWSDIIRINPRVETLHELAKAVRGRYARVFLEEIWHGYEHGHNPDHLAFDRYLNDEVGWESPHPELRSVDAYNVAFEKLRRTLSTPFKRATEDNMTFDQARQVCGYCDACGNWEKVRAVRKNNQNRKRWFRVCGCDKFNGFAWVYWDHDGRAYAPPPVVIARANYILS